MNESTKTKKALRGSLFALFLCIVLLIGTTFAWFTDTASTGVNKIQAGNLDVGLQYNDNGNMEGCHNNRPWILKRPQVQKMKKSCGSLDVTYKLPEIRVDKQGKSGTEVHH